MATIRSRSALAGLVCWVFLILPALSARGQAADVPADSQVVSLKYAQAELAANLLKTILKDKVSVEVVEATNSLRLSGEPAALRDAGRLLRQLDVARVPRPAKTPEAPAQSNSNDGDASPQLDTEQEPGAAVEQPSPAGPEGAAGEAQPLAPTTVSRAIQMRMELAEWAIRKAETQLRRAKLRLEHALADNDNRAIELTRLDVAESDIDLAMRRVERSLVELELQSWQSADQVAVGQGGSVSDRPVVYGDSGQGRSEQEELASGARMAREVITDVDGSEVDVAVVKGSKRSLEAARQLLLREAAARAAAERPAAPGSRGGN